MLRNRTTSIQKDHQQHMVKIPSEGGSMNDVSGKMQNNNSFYNVPGLFVGLSPHIVSDCDSVRSPTSPLDLKFFSSLGNSSFRFPKPYHNTHQKSWDSTKVGLGNIVDSLDDETDDDNNDINLHEKPMLSSSSNKTILFGAQVRSKQPESLPKNSDVFFEIRDDPLEGDPFGKIPSFSLDSLDDQTDDDDINLHQKPMLSSSSNETILFGSQVRSKPKSLPKNSDVFFEIRDDPLEGDPFGKIPSFSLDSLDDQTDDDDINLHQKPMLSSSSNKTILFGSQVRSKPKSLPKNSDVFFEIRDDPLDCDPFGKIPCFSLDSDNNNAEDNSISSPMPLIGSWSAFEMELSEDYTCIISHGPNPKTTHIFGDCVLGCNPIPTGIDPRNKKESLEMSPSSPYLSDHFLSSCCFCIKKLDHGTNIYMYRGEKAFCSSDCRDEWISIEEEKEKGIREPSEYENGDENFENAIIFSI